MISIFHNSVSIIHNSKIVGPMAKKCVWFLFPSFNSLILSDELWKLKTHFRCFSFQNSVSNGIFVIKHTCMGPIVSAKSHRALLLTNPPTALSQSSHQKSTHIKIFHIQPQSSSHTHPQPSQAYRVTPPQPTRASPSSDQPM